MICPLHLSSLFLSNGSHFTVCTAYSLKKITTLTYPCFNSFCFPLYGILLWSLLPFLLEHRGCILQHLGCLFKFQPRRNCPVTAQYVPRTTSGWRSIEILTLSPLKDLTEEKGKHAHWKIKDNVLGVNVEASAGGGGWGAPGSTWRTETST